MPKVSIPNFGGMIPSKEPANLPEGMATYCRNTWVYNGNLQGWRAPVVAYKCKRSTTKSVYRIPQNNAGVADYINSIWVESPDLYGCVIRAMIADDQYHRYYFFGPDTPPAYNTLDRLKSGMPHMKLGIPAPEMAPVVSYSGGDIKTQEVRSYVYTWVSMFGEEGPPSPPLTLQGTVTGTWTISLNAPTLDDTTSRRLTQVNIYRTVDDGAGNAQYYLLHTDIIDTLVYTDTALGTSLTSNATLPSTGWTAPPALQGCVAMANGMLAGWANDTDIWFCEPYRPHAWPAAYAIAVDFPIVGMAAIGSSLLILTTGTPYMATGQTPDTVSLASMGAKEPCISRGSIISAPEGVYYASLNGLVLLTSSGVSLATLETITRRDWESYNPYNFSAQRYGTAYIAFLQDGALTSTGDNGIAIDQLGISTAFGYLAFPGPVTNTCTDDFTGAMFVLSGGKVYDWDSASSQTLMPYVWTSKPHLFTYDQQFYGARTQFTVPQGLAIPTPTNESRNTSPTQVYDPTSQYLLLRVYADKRLVYTQEIISKNDVVLFPSGFKASYWEFEFEGQVVVKNFKAATSVKELQSV